MVCMMYHPLNRGGGRSERNEIKRGREKVDVVVEKRERVVT